MNIILLWTHIKAKNYEIDEMSSVKQEKLQRKITIGWVIQYDLMCAKSDKDEHLLNWKWFDSMVKLYKAWQQSKQDSCRIIHPHSHTHIRSALERHKIIYVVWYWWQSFEIIFDMFSVYCCNWIIVYYTIEMQSTNCKYYLHKNKYKYKCILRNIWIKSWIRSALNVYGFSIFFNWISSKQLMLWILHTI